MLNYAPMMTLLGAGEQRHKCNSLKKRLLRVWQRALLGFYVALLALVLPLICWGALAEPGHPHRFPHFVFTDPILATTPAGKAMADGQTHSTTAQLVPVRHGQHREEAEGAVKSENALQVCGWFADGVIPGRATPTLMLFSILLLVFFAAWAVRRLDLPHFAIWQHLHAPQSPFLPVPLPPPRLLFQYP